MCTVYFLPGGFLAKLNNKQTKPQLCWNFLHTDPIIIQTIAHKKKNMQHKSSSGHCVDT